LGWLHSRPKLHDKDDKPKSRIEQLTDGDPLLELPETNQFIVGCWHELGMCFSGGYGLTPLTFSEIKSYSDSVCQLDSFEVSAIAKMSKAYVNENTLATRDIARAAPHEGEGSIDLIRNNVAEAFKAMFKK